MVRRIISGGQTGADRAALDVAIKLNIDHGGWLPRGRKTEDGPLPSRYRLREMESDDYRERTRQNIVDSQGTLIISYGPLTGGSKLTMSYAKVIGRPNCHIDLLNAEEFEAAIIAKSFILENRIEVLNVAGPRLSGLPEIYSGVKTVLETILYLLFLDSRKDEDIRGYLPGEMGVEAFPETLDEAVALISESLPVRSRAYIAKFPARDIFMLYFVMLDFIKHRVGLESGNPQLFSHCENLADTGNCTIEDAVMEILKQLKKMLETHYTLRVVK